MDIIKLMFVGIVFIIATRGEAAIFDMSEHSGYIRGSDGTFSHVSANGTIRSVSSAQVMGTVERINIPTERGTFPVELQRSANVDMTRLGKAVSKFAQKVGPVSMAIAAVDLVCDLTNICNTNGQWIAQGNDPLPGQPNSYPASQGSWSAWGNRYVSDPETGCKDPERITANVGPTSEYVYDHMEQVNADTYKCFARSLQYGSIFYASNTSRIANCATGYQLQASNCVKTGVTESHPATAQDWTNKENLLNDDRFVPHLNNADEDIPVQFPSIQIPINKQVSNTTATNRDANGNVTGTTQTKTEVELSDGPDQTKPNEITVIEKTTVTNYDVNNNVINSTTNVVNQEKPAPQEVKIEFDNTTDTPLENYSVPASFAYDSWGSGNCPADRTVSYHYGTLNLTFEPACDFAIAMQPAILAVAGFLAMFIIAGVRNND